MLGFLHDLKNVLQFVLFFGMVTNERKCDQNSKHSKFKKILGKMKSTIVSTYDIIFFTMVYLQLSHLQDCFVYKW